MGFTPMMKQYFKIKEENKDCIVFYRLGDFYEMFFEDATHASKVLEIALTGRDCGMEEKAPMCGVPHHAVNHYINKLIENGDKVAICEQLSDPKAGKGIVERGIVRIITPGTVIDEDALERNTNSYIACVEKIQSTYAIAYCDISTGKFLTGDFSGKNGFVDLINQMQIYKPKELIILNDSFLIDNLKHKNLTIINDLPANEKADIFTERFGSKENFSKNIVSVCGYLLQHLKDTQKNNLDHITQLTLLSYGDYLTLDGTGALSLEIFTNSKGEKAGSLLSVIDYTKTAMGARKLRNYLELPLLDITKIKLRQDCISDLNSDLIKREKITDILDGVYDIERIITKLTYKTINPKDCLSLISSLEGLPNLKDLLNSYDSFLLKNLSSKIDTLEDVYAVLKKAIKEDASHVLKDGGFINSDFNEEINELSRLCQNSQSLLLELEEAERTATGIKNLKINYNKVFGYYIEVTKSYFDKVPYRYIRKQTLANCERYITEELKELENKILTAKERMLNLEQLIFEEIRNFLLEQIVRFQKTSNAIANTDALCSLSIFATRNNLVKPELNNIGVLNIEEGKHPVLSTMVDFVSNDTVLDMDENNFAVITGPNMAGKSTYMRQVALITLLAHIGSFVSAKKANIPITDKIFTRVGASDNLTGGMSTFMVEMSELAFIIDNATSKSLVILDEVGRGTSTIDGLSIAISTVSYIVNRIKCKTLFATHYHELTALEEKIKGVVNLKVAVSEQGDKVAFLHTIKKGGTDKSFGIYVAKLAGLPLDFIDKAKEVMKDISKDKLSIGNVDMDLQEKQDYEYEKKYTELKREINSIDINNLTPIKAFELISSLKESVE